MSPFRVGIWQRDVEPEGERNGFYPVGKEAGLPSPECNAHLNTTQRETATGSIVSRAKKSDSVAA